MAFSEQNVIITVGKKVVTACLSVPEAEAVNTGLILTHGAGGDMNLKALQTLAHRLASSGVLCLRFTCKSLHLGYRTRVFREMFDHLKNYEKFTLSNIFLGGRSMGARAAASLCSQMCNEDKKAITGLLCLSFPLHPVGQTDEHIKRSEDLRALSDIPVFFISGTTDNMCERKLLESVVEQMKSPSSVYWVEGANHGLAVKGRTEESVYDEVNSQIVQWILEHVRT